MRPDLVFGRDRSQLAPDKQQEKTLQNKIRLDHQKLAADRKQFRANSAQVKADQTQLQSDEQSLRSLKRQVRSVKHEEAREEAREKDRRPVHIEPKRSRPQHH